MAAGLQYQHPHYNIKNTTMTTVAPSTPPRKQGQLERLVREFQSRLLNDEWERYHEALAGFLVGRLSRPELVATIGPMLRHGLWGYHNKFLLLNYASLLLEHPSEYLAEMSGFWSKRGAKPKLVRLSQYERFKQNIMGLPLKERRRIRSITKDAGRRRGISAGITLTRHAFLPKIPMIPDKEQQQLQVNNLVLWQQDVVNGINAPTAVDAHELPDSEVLLRRVLMTMRENGLTGGVTAGTLEMLTLGLELHLKTILENAIDVARYRDRKYGVENPGTVGTSGGSKPSEVTLNVQDMHNTFEMFPHLIEPNGARYRLANVMLENDDVAEPEEDADELKGVLRGLLAS